MYPNFENKQDRASKHSALLARIARDQRLDEMKREAYANALWATDSEDTKQKDATENADLIKRIMTAMGSKTSSSESDESGSKPPAPLFSSVADIYQEMSKPTEADTNQAMSSEYMDAVSQEAALEEAEVVKKDLPPQKNPQTYKDGIAHIFKKQSEMSNIDFKPVIIRDGEILEHEYKLRCPDGEIINSKGNKMHANNRMMREVDWELTEKAVRDKVFSLMAKGDLVYNIKKQLEGRDLIKRLFQTWRANAEELGPTLRSQLNTDDDQVMKEIESLSDEEKRNFDAWIREHGFDPDSETKKRSLEDSTVSLDTRVSTKGSELSSFKARASVEYLYKNVDGLDQLKIQPFVINKNGVSQAKTIYIGDDMKLFQVSDDQEIIDDKRITNINKRIEWNATLNYLIGELSRGVRKLNILAGKEKDAQKQSLLYIRMKHILDIIKVVDPKQGADDEALLQFEDATFQTPDQRRKKATKSISAKKQKEKDFTYEPTGKGLVGRGLRGAGVLKKNRSYNLADIEGSGKASDLKYKRIGTKFIRKADLNNNRLKLVFPNRTSVGPIRAMSNEFTEMVKDLLYNDNISQQAYRALPIEDQRVFYEIVKKTHVQHTLQTPIEDPRLTLKAEFDKLRGEIQLGNDNPDMLRELYRLATDMFEQKMITSSEFKTIMSALL